MSEPLATDVGDAAPDHVRDLPARTELERLLGPDLARRLLTALAPGQARRGASSP